jgi:hypothetical protein
MRRLHQDRKQEKQAAKDERENADDRQCREYVAHETSHLPLRIEKTRWLPLSGALSDERIVDSS